MEYFEQEITGNLHNEKIAKLLSEVKLITGKNEILDNLRKCYDTLIKNEIFPPKEGNLIEPWFQRYKFSNKKEIVSMLNQQTTAVENQQQAETYLAQGKLALAQAACQKALVQLPDFAPAYKTLGNISLAMGQKEEAMSWYTKALAAQPDWAEVYANIGSLYGMQKQWQLAIASYQKAITLQPNVVKTRTNHVRKHNLKKKKGGYKYLAVEFTQSLV